ncbi:MAG: hypothetical protein ACR5LG_04850 [Sodalis sp. (in: enterobacteria)]|uniref:hypothetical protein n=1 Tax=Sodalis sp. (in: enterobacteria) TaxID=1898979 RepID=UPI003F371536
MVDPHVNFAMLTPPNSRGIVRSPQGASYLLLGKQVIKIDKHPLLSHIYMLGPEQTDKVLCRFDRGTQRFVLVPYERGYVSSSGQEINYVKVVGEAQRRFQDGFLQQSQKIRYRDGFRTDKIDEYRQVLEINSVLGGNIKGILLYGLDEGELALAGKYTGAARELREGVITARKYINQIKNELMLGKVDNPLLQRVHEIFTVEPDSDEAEALLITLLRNIEDTGNKLARHISDNFSRIWLVEYHDPNLVGEVYHQDPLKRIFINIKKSSAYHHNKRVNVKCRFLCSHYKVNDDVATFLHEASHNAAKTKDYFYLDSLESQRLLNEEMDKLLKSDIAKKGAKGIIDMAKTLKVTLPPFKDKPLAWMLYNYYPQVRGRFLMQNADLFSQIIMELADRIEPKAKRDTVSVKRLSAEVLALFITRALWQAGAAPEGGGMRP